MRINRTYSKWSVAMIAAAALAVILSSFELSGFEGLFLIYVLMCFIIATEVITVFSENMILKGIANILTLIVSGYGFFFLIMIGLIVFFGAAGGKVANVTLSYTLLMICNVVLFFGSGSHLLKLFLGENKSS
ncbi:hypothetical protein ACX0HA_00360 [Flavobacterium hauense]